MDCKAVASATVTTAVAAAPVPVELMPATVYVVVVVGLPVQVKTVVPAHVPPVQTYEVAPGQLAVRVDEAPAAMGFCGAASKQTGTGGVVTVTVAFAAAPLPAPFTPATE